MDTELDLTEGPIVPHNTNTGRPPTASLFYEFYLSGSDPIFTLKKEDHKGYLSIFKLYDKLTEDDPSEYNFAVKVFGSLKYWQDVSETARLKPYVEEMREIASTKRKAKVLQKIGEKVASGTATFSEQKLYFEFSAVEPKKAPKSKKPVEVSNPSGIDDDYNRIVNIG